MEVDEQGPALGALDAMSNLIQELSEKPLSYPLHYKHIALAQANEMGDHVQAARQMLTSYLAATDDVWLPYIEWKISTLSAESITVAEYLETEGVFANAEKDYLSIPILRRHIDWLMEQSNRVLANDGPLPDGFVEMYAPEMVSKRVSAIVAKAKMHLSRSHELWDTWMEWERNRTASLGGERRTAQVEVLQTAYMERLATPHSTHQQTYQSYSTFVSSFLPPEAYEDALIKATEARQAAVKQMADREAYEYSLPSLPAYLTYLKWESEPKEVKTRYRKGKKNQQGNKPEKIPPNPELVVPLYERAISEAASQRAEVLRGVGGDNESGEALAAAEAWLGELWGGLSTFLRENARNAQVEQDVLARAARSVPANGAVLASQIRAVDLYQEGEEDAVQRVSEIYDTAMTSGLLDVPSITAVTIARAAFELHKIAATEEPDVVAFQRLIQIVEGAIEKSREKGGDESLKMEKLLVHALVTVGGLTDDAIEVYEKASKFHKKKYFVWTEYTSFLTNQLRDYDRARKIYKSAATPSRNLDYPQAVWNAWVGFEEVHGSVEELEYALKRVRKMGLDLVGEVGVGVEKATEFIQDAVQDVPVAPAPPQEEATAMVVDAVPPAAPSNKRKAEDEVPVEPPAKKAKEDVDVPLKRDRENSTVFVAGLWKGLGEDELKKLFKDCGPVREVKITTLPTDVVATVEFMDKESVPAALTKDKKRIQGNEVSVFLAWQSTLFVTNFPEKADDASVREMFGKYGLIFDVRWPSKKFKATRRFCYIQYTSPSSAQSALELNNTELEPGMPMNVYISNPQRKKERTDANVQQREIYVAGLAKSTTQKELEELFGQCGPLKGVRLPLDEHGKAKGFGFVEFEHETSALAALAYNNREVKKRRIAVTMVDPRAPGRKEQPQSGLGRKADTVARSVRIKGLPAGSEEGLLQQAIEKIAPGVKKVEVFQDVWEAVVEFATIADASKLLLSGQQLEFQGQQLQMMEESEHLAKAKPAASTKAIASTAAPSFVPRAAAKPKARLGLGSSKPKAASAASVSSNPTFVPSAASGHGGPSKSQDAFRAMLGGGK